MFEVSDSCLTGLVSLTFQRVLFFMTRVLRKVGFYQQMCHADSIQMRVVRSITYVDTRLALGVDTEKGSD